ncbi:hypothetical protein [Succinimonas sp.]|uniref:hypothetical protein n=1 Tax=Succinimonas sp. TaxID=1936151 RepID=UPI003868829D
MLLDEINKVLLMINEKIVPLDPETKTAVSSLNGFNVEFRLSGEEELLRLSAAVFEVENIYDDAFQTLSKEILILNSPEKLPSDLRLGVDTVDQTVTMQGVIDVSGALDAESIGFYIKTMLFYLPGVREDLLRVLAARQEEQEAAITQESAAFFADEV